MNESTGGALLTDIVVIIIGIIIVLFVASFAYNKAYNAKQIIVNKINENNGVITTMREDVKDHLQNIGYRMSNRNCKINNYERGEGGTELAFQGDGYCIYQVNEVAETDDSGSVNSSRYYVVETYMDFDIPLFSFSIPIHGQTRSFRN